jgi:hypothetical protein
VRTILAVIVRMTRLPPWINTFALVFLVALTTACQERSAGAGGGIWGSSEPQPNAALQSFVDGKALDAPAAGADMPVAERALLVDIENGKAVLGMRVVVGGPDNKTPIFADQMTHVVFSPYWNVPEGIGNETIPAGVDSRSDRCRNESG